MRRIDRIARVVVACTAATAIGACSAPDDARTATPAPPSSAAPTTSGSSTSSSCPNPEGGVCLGPVAAGSYTTKAFTPTLTYSVPEGWSNLEDTPGNFLLVPGAGDLDGVNGATSDFIGVYSDVAAPNGCDAGTAPGVGSDSADLLRWINRNPGFAATAEKPVTIGGLAGMVVDLRMAKGWKGTCPYSSGAPVVPLITGVGISALDHNLVAGQLTRLYLLDHDGVVIAIEVVDIADAHHAAGYSAIVSGLTFSTS